MKCNASYLKMMTQSFRIATSQCLTVNKSSAAVLRSNVFYCSSRYQHTKSFKNELNSAKPFSAIPGPPHIPFFGVLSQFIKLPGAKTSKKHALGDVLFNRFGPIVKIKTLGRPWTVLTNSPEDAKVILTSTFDRPDRDIFRHLQQFRNDDPFYDGKAGVFPENGDEWWRVRSKVDHLFLKPQVVEQYLSQVDEITCEMMQRIDNLQEATGRVPDDFLYELYKWALECVGVVILEQRLHGVHTGTTGGDLPTQIMRHQIQFFDGLSLELGRQGSWPFKYFGAERRKKMTESHEFLKKVAVDYFTQYKKKVGEADSAVDTSSVLYKLHECIEAGELTQTDVVTLLQDALIAGVDTTAHCAGFTLYLLAKNPEFQKRLQVEIDAVMKGSDSITPGHVIKMPNLYRCLKESLRLYPLVIGTHRILSEDVVLSGYRVPAGTVAVNLHIHSCKQEQYFQQAAEFLPDRWARDKPLGPIHPCNSLPFGHGKRVCLGRRIAEQEIYTLLIRVLQKYTVHYDSDEPMTYKTLVFLKPTSPLKFKFVPRNSC